MKRKTILVLAGLLILAMPLLARMDTPAQVAPQSQNRLLTEVTDDPADWWMIWWVDAGNLSDFQISNTLQGGYFKRHPADEHEYRGELAAASVGWYGPDNYGDCAEYPKGSEQFYNFAWGLWVGSHYQVEPGEYVYNVSKGAFNTDMGAMAAPEMKEAGGMRNISALGMYFSDMTIPEGYGYDGEGGRLFPAIGATPMEYQVYWPFTDSADINPRRRAIGMPEVSPEVGDIISMQDSYACGGDWIPMSEARGIWIMSTGAYDVRGQGLRIEQRTYAWNYEYNDSYVFINYKIRNMNDFTLDSVYFSFFMDNDIGEGGTSPGDDGYYDDLIGFDEELNMGYTYDANGSETGWVTPAGYIGAVFLDTPNDIGLTGFETWQNGHEIDESGQDSLKYARMASDKYIIWVEPNDVRMLMNSGPYMELAPEEEVNLTIAVIVAYSYDELREKAIAAKIQFDNGYFGYSPPPNPSLAVVPGDSVVFLTWGSESENYVDPMSGLATFEGYRVYKSLSGLTDTWQLLADYDLADSENPDTAVVEHTSGPSKASIRFLGMYKNVDALKDPSEYGFCNNIYTLTFQPDTLDTHYIIYDLADQNILQYNEDNLDGGGYCILEEPTSKNPNPLPDGHYYYPYESGDIIFIHGGLYTIEAPADSQPIPGEVFTIYSYPGEALSGQAGVRHYYIDEDVRNGQIYYYSVTAYSRPQPTEGVDALEGGKTGKTYWAVPRTNPAGWENAWVSPAERVAGSGNALVIDSVISPDEITGHAYEVGFRADASGAIRFAFFEDVDPEVDSIVLDGFPVHAGELSGPIIDGVLVRVAAVSVDTLDVEELIDTLQTGWIEKDTLITTDMHFDIDWPGIPGPVPITKDFLIEIVENGQDNTPSNPKTCPISISLYDDQARKVEFFWLNPAGNEIKDGYKINIYYPEFNTQHPEYLAFSFFFQDTVTEVDTTGDTLKWVTPPQLGDKFLIKTLVPTTEEDRFRYQTYTAGLTEENIEDELDKIRVVPNPYYVRAPWDIDQHSRHVMFQDLPMKCTIRIFNSAGLLIRIIEHDGEGLYGAAGSEEWNLLTEGGMDCTSGLYIWQVQTETTDGKKYTKVGKFAIIR
jgi:hypothetical protein